MCPLCVANMAVVVAGATSSGGVTAFAVSKILRRKTKTNGTINGKEKNNEDTPDRFSE